MHFVFYTFLHLFPSRRSHAQLFLPMVREFITTYNFYLILQPQFSLILDIVNKLVLYVEPKRKELTDKVEEMKFSLQLANEKSAPRAPIIDMQSQLRLLLAQLKQLERNQYQIRKALNEPDIDNNHKAL